MICLITAILAGLFTLALAAVAYQIGWRDGWDDRTRWRIGYVKICRRPNDFTSVTAGKAKAPVSSEAPEALDRKGVQT